MPASPGKETIPFTFTTKIIEYLGINLPKGAKYFYAEYYKSLLKEIEKRKKKKNNNNKKTGETYCVLELEESIF